MSGQASVAEKMAAENRTETEEWKDALEAMRKPWPKDKLSIVDRKSGGKFTYASDDDVMDFMDALLPGQWSEETRLENPATCAYRCALTIRGVTRTGIGMPNSPIWVKDQKGQPLSKEPDKEASTDALRRAAARFGICRDLYRGLPGTDNAWDDTSQEPGSANGNGHQAAADPKVQAEAENMVKEVVEKAVATTSRQDLLKQLQPLVEWLNRRNRCDSKATMVEIRARGQLQGGLDAWGVEELRTAIGHAVQEKANYLMKDAGKDLVF